jgi:carbon storage regulator
MLVLTRQIGEEIVIDNSIRVTVLSIHHGKVRLGVDAPRSVSVDRAEVHARKGDGGADVPHLARA